MNFNLIFAIILGIAPTLLWLWFWLKEDPHPEPKRRLIFAFMAGALSTFLAFVIEFGFFIFTRNNSAVAELIIVSATSSIIAFAFFEEIIKYFAAKVSVLRGKDYDEPVDAMIYLITAALGFAAAENILFLVGAFERGFAEGILVSNLRFISTSLLHGLSSAIVGAGLAFPFFNKKHRGRDLFFGLFTAILLHSLYNFFIIKDVAGNGFFYALILLWIGGGIVLLLFERIKRITITNS